MALASFKRYQPLYKMTGHLSIKMGSGREVGLPLYMVFIKREKRTKRFIQSKSAYLDACKNIPTSKWVPMGPYLYSVKSIYRQLYLYVDRPKFI